MGIKIFDLDEAKLIGFKRAMLREAPWITTTVATLVYLFFILFVHKTNNAATALDRYNDFGFYISLGWLIIELITMLANEKRRALHDWLAKSVVVKINVAS